MKAAVVTATRAEYGILKPLIRKLAEDPETELRLLVTGTHLSEAYGRTEKEIEQDGFPICRRIPILEEGNTALAVSRTMANALIGFADYFAEERPDFVLVLGDRTELLGICGAAMNAGIPIVHLHGGERTEGAVDDCVRHAITKMSYLHFPATEEYRKRIIRMGEAPDRVFNVGALGVENILKEELLSDAELRAELGIPSGKELVTVTFHPVTLEAGSERRQVEELLDAMESEDRYFYLMTKANADAGGEEINRRMEVFAEKHDHAKLVSSLGMKRYLSALRCSRFVLGNSSSGILEAPALGTPTVNIGDRQKGRLAADTVICCMPEKASILAAMERAARTGHTPSFLYGDGHTSDRMMKILKQFFTQGPVVPRKTFYEQEQI
jgi:GDP/UDP-N,N'-diacetylbacillosamine 2-epimerase (hydrolysing)